MKYTARKFLILSLVFCTSGIEIAAQTCTTEPANLIAWYRAENNPGDSRGGYNGTLNGNTFAPGHVGQAFDFSNETGVTVVDNAVFNQQSFTIEAWVTAQNFTCPISCAQFIAAKSGSTGSFGYELGTNKDTGFLRLTFNGAAGGADLIDDVSLNDGNFHHVAASYDGTTMKIFLDGVLSAQRSVTTTINYEANSSFVIGARQFAGSTFPYNGLIDELSFYNRALTDAEILAIFNAGSAGKCLGTLAAGVSVGGRILTAAGRGIPKAHITLTDSKGAVRSALTSSFGYYMFDEVTVGETYILTVQAKRYRFINSSRVISAADSVADADFTALH